MPCYESNRAIPAHLDDGRCVHCQKFLTLECPYIGHFLMVKRILESNGEIIVGIGSAQYSHTGENPFTAGERYEMIKRALDAEGIHNYHIVPIPDTHVHSVWVSHVTSIVPRFDIVYTNADLVVRLFRH